MATTIFGMKDGRSSAADSYAAANLERLNMWKRKVLSWFLTLFSLVAVSKLLTATTWPEAPLLYAYWLSIFVTASTVLVILGYGYHKRLVNRPFAITLFVINVIYTALSFSWLLYTIYLFDTDLKGMLLAIGGYLLLVAPLIYVQYMYCFGLKSLWENDNQGSSA